MPITGYRGRDAATNPRTSTAEFVGIRITEAGWYQLEVDMTGDPDPLTMPEIVVEPRDGEPWSFRLWQPYAGIGDPATWRPGVTQRATPNVLTVAYTALFVVRVWLPAYSVLYISSSANPGVYYLGENPVEVLQVARALL